MTTIKKQFVELVEFLAANEGKKVSTILPTIYKMCESKKKDTTTLYDEDGNLIAIFCYYHKQWELISQVEYGKKANTKTGLNTMCKVGVSKWTKAQAVAQKARDEILNSVTEGTLEPSLLKDKLAEVEEERNVIDMTDAPQGFFSEQEVFAAM